MSYSKMHKLHIVTAVAVIRNEKGKYLVLKRRDDEVAYPGMYTFPGGKLEDNETTEEALAKEIEEEAGLEIKPGKILLKDKSFVRPDGQTTKSFSYFCEAVNPDGVKISEDFTDYRWVNIEELEELPHVGIKEELLRAEEMVKSGCSLEAFKTKSAKEDLRK